jgi:uncharacterized integral membrane protein
MTEPNAVEDRESLTDADLPSGDADTTRTPTLEAERLFVGTGLFWGLAVGVLLAVAMIVLAAQNTSSTTIAFLGWEFSTPLIVVILGTLLVGVVFDELFGLVYRVRRRRTMRDRDQLNRIERSRTDSP